MNEDVESSLANESEDNEMSKNGKVVQMASDNEELGGQIIPLGLGRFPAKAAEFRAKLKANYDRYAAAMDQMIKISSARAEEAEELLESVKQEYRDEKDDMADLYGGQR